MKLYDIIIVGSGPAGVGMGALLKQLGVNNFAILEKHEVGSTFKKWPKETRLLTPSFPGHGFGQLDLNAIVPSTSPGYAYASEHLTGEEYADYLRRISDHFKLPVQTKVDVKKVDKEGDIFEVHTNKGLFHSKYVIWAAGEFQYPNLYPFEGSEHCIHTSQIDSWAEFSNQEHYYIIGGYESGIDAAYHLVKNDSQVTVLAKGAPWADEDPDPSVSLSPFTSDRLSEIEDGKQLTLRENEEVVEVEQESSHFLIHLKSGKVLTSPTKPIMATGYKSSLTLVFEHFYWGDHGGIELTELDESTISDGLFLIGPQVKHNDVIFCFIYKYRQRFAVVANEICTRLGLQVDERVLEFYRQAHMYLDDLSCCDNSCMC
ncbi:NAD(P)-binding domain-containing protein [Bacillus shivajii]|uniref:NAD(P)/FAD-dependent oxidoreductase n=1 Tax=Bacillus shivajii TaxID=1983719 RepID=UPI001CFB3560|nr:NAD(P)/FAD-dependent oxidoreductase [Bacillus shivajii]UCZ54207.1 NAD(P)-binding domain-containing protein [Bacillus shivajii]